jgi:hypothetical protein
MSRTRKVKRMNRKKRRTRKVKRISRKRRTRKKGGAWLKRNSSDKIKVGDHIRARDRNHTLVKNLDFSDNTGITGNFRYEVEGIFRKQFTKYLKVRTPMFKDKQFLILPSDAVKDESKTFTPAHSVDYTGETREESAKRLVR